MTKNTNTNISEEISAYIEQGQEVPRNMELSKERVPLYKQNGGDIYSLLDAGYRYRIVNDKYGRIDQFKRAGWEIVPVDLFSTGTRSEATQASSGAWRPVNYDEKAPCVNGVLMRIPLELWESDNRAKMAEEDDRLDEIDATRQLLKNLRLAVRANMVR